MTSHPLRSQQRTRRPAPNAVDREQVASPYREAAVIEIGADGRAPERPTSSTSVGTTPTSCLPLPSVPPFFEPVVQAPDQHQALESPSPPPG